MNFLLIFILIVLASCTVSAFRMKKSDGKRFKSKQKELIYLYVLPLISLIPILIILSFHLNYDRNVCILLAYLYFLIIRKNQSYFMELPVESEVAGTKSFPIAGWFAFFAFVPLISASFIHNNPVLLSVLMLISLACSTTSIYLYFIAKKQVKSCISEVSQ